MKKLFIYGVTALAMLTGCNDLLDKSPLDTFTNTPAYWSNTDNLDNQCNTFYNNFTGFGNGASGGWFYFKTISDDQVDAESHNWTYTNVVASSTNWSAPFTEIRRANYIIAGVQSSSLDEATKAHYEGLARMNRAWEYYQLVRMYGDVQWIDKVIDPADNEALYGPRTDRDEVMDHVLADINYACEHITANSNRQRFSTDMAYAMKADITLYEGTYCKYRTQAENGKAADESRANKYLQECVSACEYLMAKNYSLSNSYKANYNSVSLASNPEMIFYKPYALETTVFQKLAFASIIPNLLIIVTSSFGFMRGQKEGMIIGFFCGLLKDILGGNLLGFYALIYMLIGYGNGFFQRVFYDEDIKLPLALIAGSEFLYGMVIYVLLFMLKSDFHFLHYLRHVIMPELVYTILVTLVLYQIILHINRRLEEEEKRSASRFV